MNIGDRVQTLNTFVPITGEIVDMYKNRVTIADDDAETVDQLLSFHADELEVIQMLYDEILKCYEGETELHANTSFEFGLMNETYWCLFRDHDLLEYAIKQPV